MRTDLQIASQGSWLCCEAAKNTHVLPCTLRVIAAPRLALSPDTHFGDRFFRVTNSSEL